MKPIDSYHRIGAVLDQQAQRIRVAHGQMQPGAARGDALARETGIAFQQFAQRVHVSSRTRPKELSDIRSSPPIDFGLQRSPAWKAMLLCNRTLCVSKLRRRIGRAQRNQPLLRELLQVLERRAFEETSGRHRHLPSIYARCPQLSGWKSGSLTVNEVRAGGFDP